ncbi:hypothetical protein BEWA_004740 [Theileria equi strain WA]|uniref:Uncharacterized protein n=1 Tax=Theileria equi strain WA TaxID=1537102 RepID=L0B1D9_THEEQ|nr:hypothetical protein BEWA_004740 [Theileria equi strain WA]AFZ81066.1 hypothetical protein BEWA_004740 [Theileria equi strain WA]|eukprot:XP_004830732.1 hypothetical protein BEWA_004740 [Theileria equi strain WA]
MAEDSINSCYEGLLDLKCIFPSWSDLQNNFYFHWKQILDYSTNSGDEKDEVIEFYSQLLAPVIGSKDKGIESKAALELVRQLDDYRRKNDKEFEPYVLEEVLNRDTSSIKPPQKAVKTPAVKKKVPATPKPIIVEDGPTHVYGTRKRSKMMLNSESAGMGEHLKRGFYSDYIWDFMMAEKVRYAHTLSCCCRKMLKTRVF